MSLKRIGKRRVIMGILASILLCSGISVNALSNYSLSDFKFKYDKEIENGIELISCNTKEAKKLISPLGKYNLWGKYIIDENSSHVTKINDDFSFIEEEKITEKIKVNKPDFGLLGAFEGMSLFDADTSITYYNNIYADIREIDLPMCRSVGNNGLFGVENLVSVKMPMCSKIEENGFSNCKNLESIELSKDYTRVSNGTFEKCYMLDNFNNWENIEFIGNAAFHGTNFEKIAVPNCNSIGDRAFLDCRNLKSFKANKGYINVKAETFRGCRALDDFENIENIEKIGQYGFEQTAFSSIKLPNCIELENNSFGECHNLINVDLPVCEKLGKGAFANCVNLKEINIPKCKEIGDCCFGYFSKGCENLEFFNAPECEELGEGAFRDCARLKEVNIPKSKEIKDLTFFHCWNLKKVNMPECERVGYAAFYGCPELEEIYLPMCKKIETEAFEICPSLKKIVVAKDCVFEEGSIGEDVKVEYAGDDDVPEEVEYYVIERKMVKPSERKMKNEEAFLEEDKETGIIVSAAAGVVPIDVHMTVRKITPINMESNEENFEKAINSLDGDKLKDVEKLEMYSIELYDETGEPANLNGEVTVMFPLTEKYSLKELQVLRVTPIDDVSYEPKIVDVDGEKYCSINTNHFSIYCVCDMYTGLEYVGVFAPYVIATLGAITLTALALPKMRKTKKEE